MTSANQTSPGQCSGVELNRARSELGVWPLRTEGDYHLAVEVVDRLVVKGEENLNEAECDQLEIFTTLIEVYENEHHGIDLPGLAPVDFLKKLMDEHNMNASDLGRLLGDRSLGCRILTGERKLSKKHVRILSEHFRIDPGAFLS